MGNGSTRGDRCTGDANDPSPISLVAHVGADEKKRRRRSRRASSATGLLGKKAEELGDEIVCAVIASRSRSPSSGLPVRLERVGDETLASRPPSARCLHDSIEVAARKEL